MEISHSRQMVSALQQAGPAVTTGLPEDACKAFGMMPSGLRCLQHQLCHMQNAICKLDMSATRRATCLRQPHSANLARFCLAPTFTTSTCSPKPR